MTRNEAKTALEQGEKLTHASFTNEEWVKGEDGGFIYIFEDGVRCSPYDFWRYRGYSSFDNDWKLLND